MTSLQQLLLAQSKDQLFQLLMGLYKSNGFPVESWADGGTERTRAAAFISVLVDMVTNYLPTITGGGFLDFAQTDWLRLLAQQLFSIDFNPATFTQGNITLTAASGSGPYQFGPESITIVFASTGHRYKNTASGVIPVSGSVSTQFQAEAAGARYNDLSNRTDITLVNSLPGVTATNPASHFSAVSHVGSGTGTLTLTGTPIGSHQILIQIDSTGASGTAGWSYQLDGAPFVSAGLAAFLNNIGGTGINVGLTNGGSGTSFVNGDTYLFTAPGSWITSQGSDDESNASLKQRCRSRWSSLSDIATEEYYQLLATSTPTVGSQVTQVIVLPDEQINNRVNIVVAGPEGILPGPTVTSIQTFVSRPKRVTDNPVVQSPAALPIALTGTIFVAAAQMDAAQAAIETAMLNYVGGTPINGTLRISKIVELCMEVPGVSDMTGTQINGSSSNLVLGGPSTFVVGELTLPLGFTFVAI